MPHQGDEERRRYPRAALNLLVQFRFDTLDDFLFEYAENISEGGMFVRCEQPREVGAMIYLQFALKDGTKLIEGLGKVARSTASGMGVEFVSFDDESMQTIRAIVSERSAAPG